MTQNKNKLLDLFIGNLSNTILHKILENAIGNNEEVSCSNRLQKEGQSARGYF